MKIILKLLFLEGLFLVVNTAVLPVEKCHLEDSKCMLPAYQKMIPIFFGGMPEIGLEKIDKVDDVKFDVSGLVFTLKNARVEGLSDIVMDKIAWNLKKKVINVEFHVDCTLSGDYIATGKILSLPINGDGKMHLDLNYLSLKMMFQFEMEKKADEKNYVNIKNYTFEYDIKNNAKYHMTNLFKGNKELSDNLLQLFNDNWKDITYEFGSPMVKNVANKIIKSCNFFFSKFAVEDIALM